LTRRIADGSRCEEVIVTRSSRSRVNCQARCYAGRSSPRERVACPVAVRSRVRNVLGERGVIERQIAPGPADLCGIGRRIIFLEDCPISVKITVPVYESLGSRRSAQVKINGGSAVGINPRRDADGICRGIMEDGKPDIQDCGMIQVNTSICKVSVPGRLTASHRNRTVFNHAQSARIHVDVATRCQRYSSR
jgi:hypothetical protein